MSTTINSGAQIVASVSAPRMADILQLPDHGRLLVATDLQGNLRDYLRIVDLFRSALVDESGDAHLLFTGDLIHGPHLAPEEWPDFLGEFYSDQSPEIVEAFVALRDEYPDHVHAILGNHEHGHIGGPHTAKFAEDEVALLDYIVGEEGAAYLQEVFRTFPLIALAPCGVVFTHGAPAAEVDNLEQILDAKLDGHKGSPVSILASPIVGKILWARSASQQVARRFLNAVGGKISVFGHDVIPEGYERIGDEQMIVSTSFGVFDSHKVYLDLDLAAHYTSVKQLQEGAEILPLYPEQAVGVQR